MIFIFCDAKMNLFFSIHQIFFNIFFQLKKNITYNSIIVMVSGLKKYLLMAIYYKSVNRNCIYGISTSFNVHA